MLYSFIFEDDFIDMKWYLFICDKGKIVLKEDWIKRVKYSVEMPVFLGSLHPMIEQSCSVILNMYQHMSYIYTATAVPKHE